MPTSTSTSGSLNIGFKIIYNRLVLPKFMLNESDNMTLLGKLFHALSALLVK